MKKIFVTVFVLSFAICIGIVRNGFGKTQNFDTSQKEQSINGKKYQHFIRKLDGDIISHFTFITVMHQDLMDELAMSFRSDFNTDLVGNKRKIIEREDHWIIVPVDGEPENIEDSNSTSKKLF